MRGDERLGGVGGLAHLGHRLVALEADDHDRVLRVHEVVAQDGPDRAVLVVEQVLHEARVVEPLRSGDLAEPHRLGEEDGVVLRRVGRMPGLCGTQHLLSHTELRLRELQCREGA